MKTETAIAFYGTRGKLATAAGVTKQAIAYWIKTGVVPWPSALRLQEQTKGKLKVDQGAYTPRNVAHKGGRPRVGLRSVKSGE